jgi:nucleoside-diphosphate-sugar epimerase
MSARQNGRWVLRVRCSDLSQPNTQYPTPNTDPGKLLVTGANGFLGTAFVERLIAHGHREIRCLVRPGSQRARLEAIRNRHPDGAVELFTGTLNSPESILPALDGVSVVYHLAAGTRGTAADLFLSSVIASRNLLEAVVRREGIRVVLVSSFGVYGVAGLRWGETLDENAPLEPRPEKRDLYSYAKLRQEQLFWEYQQRYHFPLVVLRPGVIYGPGGTAISGRVGISLFGLFLHLGGRNLLPLSYVENCAEALVVAGQSEQAAGQVYNVHDDDLPTCRAYLQRYRREVKRLRAVSIPYPVTRSLSGWLERYHIRSQGQLPAVFTPYKTASAWKGTRFDNSRLKSLGWRPIISTEEGLRRTFEYLRARKQGGEA